MPGRIFINVCQISLALAVILTLAPANAQIVDTTPAKIRSFPVPRGALIRAGEGSLYYATKGLRPPEKPSIVHVRDGDMPQWFPFVRNHTHTSETSEWIRFRIRNIYVDPAGNLFVAYSKARKTGPSEMAIARAKFGEQLTEIWSSDKLDLRAFAVSPSGFIYLLGLPQQAAADLTNPNKAPSPFTAELLYVFDAKGQQIKALFPMMITRDNVSTVHIFLERSLITVRENDNFFVVFDPFFAETLGWKTLQAKDITEYSPQGTPVRTYNLLSSGSPDVSIWSTFPDNNGALIVQLGSLSVKRLPKQEGRFAGGYKLDLDGSSIVQIDAAGIVRPIYKLPKGEKLLGWMGRSRAMVTEMLGQGTMVVHNLLN